MLNNLKRKLANILYRAGSVYVRPEDSALFHNLGEVEGASYSITSATSPKSTSGREHFMGGDIAINVTMRQTADEDLLGISSLVQKDLDVFVTTRPSRKATMTLAEVEAASEDAIAIMGCAAQVSGEISFASGDSGFEITFTGSLSGDLSEIL